MAKSAKQPTPARPRGPVSPAKPPKAGKEAKAAKLTSAASGLPGPAPKASESSRTSKPSKPDSSTKQSHVLSMLRSPTGATIAAITHATGWQQHSVRGFLSAVVRKRLKLKLTSEKLDGARTYQITGDGDAKASARRPKTRGAT